MARPLPPSPGQLEKTYCRLPLYLAIATTQETKLDLHNAVLQYILLFVRKRFIPI